jgi:hypothetical protein
MNSVFKQSKEQKPVQSDYLLVAGIGIESIFKTNKQNRR